MNKSVSATMVTRVTARYYNWLLSSVMGSIILFGGFTYAKGSTINQTIALLIAWLIASLINGTFWAAIAAAVARAMKRNWKNAALGTFAAVIFIQACITLAQTK